MRFAGTLPDALTQYADKVSERVARRDTIWTKVDDEVWREAIGQSVAQRLGCDVLRVPDASDPDALVHLLAQVLGTRAFLAMTDSGAAIDQSVRALTKRGRPVVVLGGRQARDAEAAASLSPAQVELERLLDVWSREVPQLLWLAPHSAPPEWRGRFHPRFELAMEPDAWASCLDSPVPAALARITDRALTPTQLSAVVVLLQLGREHRVRDAIQQPQVVDHRSGPAAMAPEELPTDQAEGLAIASALRMPLPRARLPDAAQRSSAFDALAWESNQSVFVPRRLCAWARTDRRLQSAAHDALAATHRALDGARDPLVGQTSVFHWIEKVHHLARGTDSSIQEWDDQRLPSPAFYWDRGRHLSLSKKFAEAAKIYERCLARFPGDAYALHYHAFNLERAGLDRALAERHYREAIDLDPGNVWFHRRLVTFYIGLSRLSKAREAWREACHSIDEDTSWARNEQWLGENLHLGVASAWLDHGDPREARRIIEALDPEVVERSSALSALSQRIAHGVEVDSLGDAVYPPSTPFIERWSGPRVLDAILADGAPLEQWWPGRVVHAAPDRVSVVLADPESRTLMDQDFTGEEWARAARSPAANAAGFFELGRYRDTLRIARVPMYESDFYPAVRPETPYLDSFLG